MADIKVTEATRQAVSSKTVDDLDFTGNHTRIYHVLFPPGTDVVGEPILAVDHGAIPQLWDEHPNDSWMYVQSISCHWLAAHFWEVTVNYSRTEEPLCQPMKIEWTFATSTEPIDRDADGEAITNSAGVTFDQPLSEEIDDQILRITRNEETFDANFAADYKGAVNSDTFWGFPPRTCRLKIFDGVKARAAGLWFWQVTYEFHIRYDASDPLRTGWNHRVLDQGYQVKTGALNDDGSPEYETLTDASGQPLREPVLLDGNGNRLAKNADPVYLEFETAPARAFSALDLAEPTETPDT